MIAALDARDRTGGEATDPDEAIRSGPGAQSGSGVDARRAELTADDPPRVSGRAHPRGLGRSDRGPGESAGSRFVLADLTSSIFAPASGDYPAHRCDTLGIRIPYTGESQELREAPLPMARVPRPPRRVSSPPGPGRVHPCTSSFIAGHRRGAMMPPGPDAPLSGTLIRPPSPSRWMGRTSLDEPSLGPRIVAMGAARAVWLGATPGRILDLRMARLSSASWRAYGRSAGRIGRSPRPPQSRRPG